jgi:hypothetical protein
MPARKNKRASPIVRGFILGQLYERGHAITTKRIRKLGMSRATAKRDMRRIASVVPVTLSKPVRGLRSHVARRGDG